MNASIPVVLLHAFPLNATMWAPQVEALGDRTILTPDFPGFGGRPAGPTELARFGQTVLEESVLRVRFGRYQVGRGRRGRPEEAHRTGCPDAAGGRGLDGRGTSARPSGKDDSEGETGGRRESPGNNRPGGSRGGGPGLGGHEGQAGLNRSPG
jgi:hypothetical protein